MVQGEGKRERLCKQAERMRKGFSLGLLTLLVHLYNADAVEIYFPCKF